MLALIKVHLLYDCIVFGIILLVGTIFNFFNLFCLFFKAYVLARLFAILPYFRLMYANGMDTLTFSAKANADAELRIFAKKNDGLDNNWIQDGKADGVKVYQDYTLTTEYATYTIDLAEFFALADAADINYIGIVVKAAAATEVFLKSATFSASQA